MIESIINHTYIFIYNNRNFTNVISRCSIEKGLNIKLDYTIKNTQIDRLLSFYEDKNKSLDAQDYIHIKRIKSYLDSIIQIQMYYIINKYNCVIDEKKYFQKNIFFYVKKNIFRKKIFSKKKKIQEKNFG